MLTEKYLDRIGPLLTVDFPSWLPVSPAASELIPIGAVLLTLHCLIGIVAAVIARRKQHNFSIWLPLGLIGGTPILLIALLLQPRVSPPLVNDPE